MNRNDKNNISIDILFIISIFILSLLLFYPKGLILESFYAPGDEMTYKNLAIKLVKEKIYAESFDNLRSWRPPGYPFYLSIFYFGFGDYGFKIVPYANLILYILSFYLLFRLTYLYFEKLESYLICLIVFLFHFNKFNEVLIINYSETLFFFLLTSFLYLFIRSLLRNNNKGILMSFFILGISYMVRGPSLPLGIIILFFFCVFQKTFSKKIICASIFLFLLPYIMWIVRNYYILGFGPHMYTANYIISYYGLFDILDSQKIDELGRGLDDLGKVNLYKSLILNKIKANYIGTIFFFIKKFIKHLYYHNTYLILFILILSTLGLYLKDQKNFFIFICLKKTQFFLICLIISIIFLMIASIAQFSWRYSLIPSIFFLLFTNYIIKILFAICIVKKINL
jgi:hypothetical protein